MARIINIPRAYIIETNTSIHVPHNITSIIVVGTIRVEEGYTHYFIILMMRISSKCIICIPDAFVTTE